MRVLILLEDDGTIAEVVTDAPAEVVTVCEHAPNDRLYRLTMAHEVSATRCDEIIAGDRIGSARDARHEALSARILNGGKPPLKPVT